MGTPLGSPEPLPVSQRDLIPSRDQAGVELAGAQTLPGLQPPTRQPPKCQTPKCTIHTYPRALLSQLSPQPRDPLCTLQGERQHQPGPPSCVWGVCCMHGPSKISTAPAGGGCLHGKLSSPGFIPTRGQSKLGEKLLRCLLWDQRTPPSQLDPAEKHTGRGLSSSLPLSMHGGNPAPRKGSAEPGQRPQHHLPGCPPGQGGRDAPAGPVVPEMQGRDKKLQLGLNPCMAGAKPAVLSRDPLQEAQKGFLPPSQPLCRFWGGLRLQPCCRGCPELGDPWATQPLPPAPYKLSQGTPLP